MGYENITFDKDTVFLVTGGAGFIGSNLCEVLLNRGHKVRCLDDFSIGKKENIELFIDHHNLSFVEGDIRDIKTCKNACIDVDYVLHQAAWGSVPRSIEHPVLYEEINIHGTLNMMQAAREAKVKRFVYASSSSVYGDSEKLPKIEGEEGKVLSPYALTKVVNEEHGRLYDSLYGLKTVGLRYFNVFGKRQDPNSTYAAVIPIFVKKLLSGQAPTINGDGRQSRDFTYVENVIEANLKSCLAPKEACGEVYNIAYGGREYINDLYKKLCVLLDIEVAPIYGQERVGDIRHSNADISKAKKIIGYNPSYDINKGLEEIIVWYKSYLK